MDGRSVNETGRSLSSPNEIVQSLYCQLIIVLRYFHLFGENSPPSFTFNLDYKYVTIYTSGEKIASVTHANIMHKNCVFLSVVGRQCG